MTGAPSFSSLLLPPSVAEAWDALDEACGTFLAETGPGSSVGPTHVEAMGRAHDVLDYATRAMGCWPSSVGGGPNDRLFSIRSDSRRAVTRVVIRDAHRGQVDHTPLVRRLDDVAKALRSIRTTNAQRIGMNEANSTLLCSEHYSSALDRRTSK